MLTFFIANTSPELFSFGSFALRWYGLLFILGFLLCRNLLFFIYKKQGQPEKDVNPLILFMLAGGLLTARVSFVIFFQPDVDWSKPMEIFLPFGLKPVFHFMGLQALSIHGVAVGVLLAVWIYCKIKKGYRYLPTLDTIVIVAALSGPFILIGNFLNAEPIGKPTDAKLGTAFTRPLTDGLLKVPCCIMRNPGGKNPLESVSVGKDQGRVTSMPGHQPIVLYLFFKPGITEQIVTEFLQGDVKAFLFDRPTFAYEPGTEPLHYTIFAEKDKYTARVRTIGIARHPVQIIEAITCLLLFLFLFRYWRKHKANLPAGKLFGFFSVTFWGLHFALDFLKMSSNSKTGGFPVVFGQLLSILFFIAGVVVLLKSYRTPKASS